MRVHDKAIVLQRIRHGDKQSVVKLYTRAHGIVSVIASPSRSARAKIRPSAVMPLNLLDVVYEIRSNRELQRLSEASCYYLHEQIGRSMAKLAIAQFLNELLLKTLRESQSNPQLFDFIEHHLNYLNDADRDFGNLHLYFMRELAGFLGFEPHNNYPSGGPYFDCREGVFAEHALPFPLGLDGPSSKTFSGFLTGQPLRTAFTPSDRALLLEILLAYYALHVPGFGEMKSVEVLKSVGEAMRGNHA